MSKHTKHVRFAPQNIVYPPETSISAIAVSLSSPSSSSSGSSISSSHRSKKDGLPGPTPYVFLCAPQPKALEPVKYGRHVCHPLLEMSAITYDLRDPISTAKTVHNNHSLFTENIHESAFIPPLSHTTITSSYLPWTIKVYASNGSYITSQDILTSIYSTLRTNITPTEFQLLPSQHHRNRATRTYERRYRRLRHQLRSEIVGDSELSKASQSEKRAGMKRVDFLMGYTRFLGISNKGCQCDDEWNLHVASSTMEL